MDYDLHIPTYISRHNTSIFDNIGKNMDALVRKKTKARTMHMVNVLEHRENLGHSWGKFPRSDLPKSHSHAAWRWSKTSIGYQIKNEHRAKDGYPYVRNLVAGTGWSAKVLSSSIGGKGSRLVRNNGRVFSSQMPFGLNPWILHQRKILIQELKLASGDKIIRGGRIR